MNNTAISPIAIGLSAMSLLALATLHVVSAEINPAWHMVSEYALGEYGWMLAIFFIAWGFATWVTAFAIVPYAKKWTAKLGVFLLFITGLGALMGGLFDVYHSLHGVAFGLGVPFLPIAALLISRYVRKTYGARDAFLRIASHAPWITLILMAIAMGLYISALQAAGVTSETPEIMTELPAGVSTFHGIPNRLLVVAYLGWLIAINRLLMRRKAQNA